MKVAIASDHRGYALKETLKALLGKLGHEVLDFGPSSADSCDYPDCIIPAAEAVAKGEAERGIVICGTGLGASIAANKVKGIRAARCASIYDAEMARRHNDANVLALGADTLAPGYAAHIVKAFLTTEFEGGRHERRLKKIAEYEAR